MNTNTLNPELRSFIDRVIVPALVDRFLREQAAKSVASATIQPAA